MDAGKFCLCTLCFLLLPGLVTCGKMIMILVDGFRWDYTDIHGPLDNLSGFKRFIDSGVEVEYLQPSFPSESMTNYVGLTTGRYAESNGMLANFMYDKERDAYLRLFELPNHRWPFWWDGAEPIWINAEKHSKPAHIYYWAGCEVAAYGINASFCIPYTEASWSTLKETARSSIQALKDDTADLIGIYVYPVDIQGHFYGPLSSQVAEDVNNTDDFIGFVMDELHNQGLVDDVDVMLFSDHGQTDVARKWLINMTDILNTDDIAVKIYQGAFVQIWPQEGKIGEVYAALRDFHPNATAYLKPDLPERWHIKNHQRTPDIWLMADLGWSIIYNVTERQLMVQGNHGYDNNEPDMMGVFMASGPHFRQGVKTGPIKVVDVYQLMCHVLELPPQPNNGTWDNVRFMLRDTRPLNILTASGRTNGYGIATVVMCFCFAWIATIMA